MQDSSSNALSVCICSIFARTIGVRLCTPVAVSTWVTCWLVVSQLDIKNSGCIRTRRDNRLLGMTGPVIDKDPHLDWFPYSLWGHLFPVRLFFNPTLTPKILLTISVNLQCFTEYEILYLY